MSPAADRIARLREQAVPTFGDITISPADVLALCDDYETLAASVDSLAKVHRETIYNFAGLSDEERHALDVMCYKAARQRAQGVLLCESEWNGS